jgi:hypothetical protein
MDGGREVDEAGDVVRVSSNNASTEIGKTLVQKCLKVTSRFLLVVL